jgi:hypothetical protein
MSEFERRVRPDELIGKRIELEDGQVATVRDAWLAPGGYTFSGRWHLRVELADGSRRTTAAIELPEPLPKDGS